MSYWETEGCPKCGDRLIGYTKDEYADHLRENGHDVAAEVIDHFLVGGGVVNETLRETVLSGEYDDA